MHKPRFKQTSFPCCWHSNFGIVKKALMIYLYIWSHINYFMYESCDQFCASMHPVIRLSWTFRCCKHFHKRETTEVSWWLSKNMRVVAPFKEWEVPAQRLQFFIQKESNPAMQGLQPLRTLAWVDCNAKQFDSIWGWRNKLSALHKQSSVLPMQINPEWPKAGTDLLSISFCCDLCLPIGCNAWAYIGINGIQSHVLQSHTNEICIVGAPFDPDYHWPK